MPQGPYLRKYGVEAKFNFALFETDGIDLKTDAAHASGDTKIMKDEGAEANTTNGFVDEGQGYSIIISATEMQCARGAIYVVDQSTKVWLDEVIYFETYGNASAQHAVDLNDAVRAGLTALPNANADATGGLPISDGGGLDLDAILADTAEIGAAGAGLTAVPWNSAWDTEVESECNDALVAYDPPTRAELTADISGLDTKINTISANVDSVLADTGTDGVVLKASGLAADAVDEILDDHVEGAISVRQALRLMLAVLVGKASGGGTTSIIFRDTGDSKDRVTVTADSDGNRTAMTLDAS